MRVFHRRKIDPPNYETIVERVVTFSAKLDDGDLATELVQLLKGAPAAKGGMTLVDVVDGEGNVLAQGAAPCSKKDNYDRRKGRTIALGRALKALKS